MRKTIATLTTLAALALAPAANAAFGDYFGIAPINDAGGPAQEVPALPGATETWWAGVCDTAAAPAPGSGTDMATLDPPGIGQMPATVLVPNVNIFTFRQTPVPAPATPPHCLHWGAPADYPATNLWTEAPNWRLPALTQAGAHPDGTATLAFRRVPAGKGGPSAAPGTIDGTVDNIYTELPPGFVADPNAVPKCTAEQFGVYPLACPPETQVGVLHLSIVGAFGGANLGLQIDESVYPVYNVEPRRGNLAELGFGYASGERAVTVRIVAKARTDSDFGVSAFVGQIPAALPAIAQEITLWGVPWAASNDLWRAPEGFQPSQACGKPDGVTSTQYLNPAGFTSPCQAPYEPAWGPIKPFVSNLTECTGQELSTRLATDSYQHPGAFTSDGSPHPGKVGANDGDPAYPEPIDNSQPGWKVYDAPAPAITGCEAVGFEPDITLEPTGPGGAAVKSADSPTGLDVELEIPQNDELPFAAPPDGAEESVVKQYVQDASSYWHSAAGLATSHLRDTVVTLPEGMALNPAAANGQGACSMDEIGVTDTDNPSPPAIRFDNAPVACPDSSKVAEVVVEAPALDEADWPTGSVYLARQGENPFGSDFAIYIAVESPDRGLIAKLAGKVEPDPLTGRLRTTFVENPQLPFERFRLRFERGPRAPLATPVTCGNHASATDFTPYSNPGGPVPIEDSFAIDSSPAGGCPQSKAQRPLDVGFSAGSTQILGGEHSPFTVRITRPDGNQELDRVEVRTPEGFAARLAGVPYCPEAGIAAAQARTATGDGALERRSPSCPQASRVGSTTIGVGAGPEPFYASGEVYLAGPYKGAPLSLAFVVPAVAGPFDLGVQVVRAGVNVNPVTAQITTASDAIPQILRGVPLRIRDIRVEVDRPGFALNPTNCAEQLVTASVTGASGAIAQVSNRFQVAECARLGFKPRVSLRLFGGIARAKYQGVRATIRPRPGDANISGAVVRFPTSAFVAQEHLNRICTRVQWAADACPSSSIYGTAEAISPLLDAPLRGNVHLRSSDNQLPDLVADLRGPAHQPIKVEVAIKNDSVKGALRNTVQVAPDTPVTSFRLQVYGGKKGLIVNSRNICEGKNAARVTFKAHNGRRSVQSVPVRNSKCGKFRKAQKRKGRGGTGRRAAKR